MECDGFGPPDGQPTLGELEREQGEQWRKMLSQVKKILKLYHGFPCGTEKTRCDMCKELEKVL